MNWWPINASRKCSSSLRTDQLGKLLDQTITIPLLVRLRLAWYILNGRWLTLFRGDTYVRFWLKMEDGAYLFTLQEGAIMGQHFMTARPTIQTGSARN